VKLIMKNISKERRIGKAFNPTVVNTGRVTVRVMEEMIGMDSKRVNLGIRAKRWRVVMMIRQ